MGQAVPMDDLPGSLVPEDDLPSELTASSQEGPVMPESTAGAMGAVAPAITGAAFSAPTGLAEIAKEVGPVVAKTATSGFGSYLKNPVNVLTDVALAHMGVPPIAAGKKLYDTYQGAKETVGSLSKVLGRLPDETLNAIKPGLDYLTDAMKPGDLKALNEQIASKGSSAVKDFKLPSYLANDAQAAAALKEVQGVIPGAMSKIGAVAGPLARGAGRVLGPAGMAMNVYDAAKFAQEAQLGERLARGEGKLAPQAFNNILNKNVSGYQPNAEEARNLLASGDERTINIYGGRQRLQQLANPNAFNSGYAQQLNALGR